MGLLSFIFKQKTVLVIGSVVVLSEVGYRLYVKFHNKPKGEILKKKKQKKEELSLVPVNNEQKVTTQVEEEEEDVWNTAIFFPEVFPDAEGSKTRQLIWYLQQTKEMLKICMYVSSFKMLEKAVFEVAQRPGVNVMAVTNVTRVVNHWRKKGVFIREKPKLIKSAFTDDMYVDLMHHKFIIIDDKAVLSGSLNWTRSGVTENRENVIITNDEGIVTKYVEEFEKIWELSEPDAARRKAIAK